MRAEVADRADGLCAPAVLVHHQELTAMKERLESVEEQARKDALDEVRAAVQPT